MNSSELQVPFLDLAWQAREIKAELDEAWSRVIQNTSFISGPEVAQFENEFALYSKTRNCIGVANGTDALEIALRALEIGPGDEVIVPANSFLASAIAVTRTGAIPVFVDCVEGTWLIDTDQVEAVITSKTKAIMPVHLYGQMADMQKLREISSKYSISLIEDMAQAQGASQNGELAGSLGDIAGTSFYPGKNLGAFGDAGAVLTQSDELANAVRALRNYGSQVKYEHPTFGFNSRLDTLQAVVLSAKLKKLEDWNSHRGSQAEFYLEMLANIPGIELPVVDTGNKHVWHLFVVKVENRESVIESLSKVGVHTGIHYPNPIHLLGAYENLKYSKGQFPISENLADMCLSLPIYPGLSEEKQSYVTDQLLKVLRKS